MNKKLRKLADEWDGEHVRHKKTRITGFIDWTYDGTALEMRPCQNGIEIKKFKKRHPKVPFRDLFGFVGAIPFTDPTDFEWVKMIDHITPEFVYTESGNQNPPSIRRSEGDLHCFRAYKRGRKKDQPVSLEVSFVSETGMVWFSTKVKGEKSKHLVVDFNEAFKLMRPSPMDGPGDIFHMVQANNEERD